jgi:pimeloyl-ACP methyl ester carboxylesterase
LGSFYVFFRDDRRHLRCHQLRTTLVTLAVRSADGRRVAVQVSGSPAGHPVFLMHGTPGSRIAPLPRPMVLHGLGVRLITFDRPGYGKSDRQEFRQVAAVVDDVVAIADALGVEKFAVLGRSGGGPHALACAALLPDRVTRAGILVSLAPRADGFDWFAGMTASNIQEFKDAVDRPEELASSLAETAAAIKADPASHVLALGPELPEADRRVVADAGIRALLIENYEEALRTSADGWFDDDRAFCSPWGFNLTDIKVPVLVWQGEDDVFSPVRHAQWLADQIPNASMVIAPGTAHFGAIEALPDIIAWLIRPPD